MTIEEIAAKKQEEIKLSKLSQEEVDKLAKQAELDATAEAEKQAKEAESKPKEPTNEEKGKEEKLPQVDEKKPEDKPKDPEAVKKRKEELQKEIDRMISEKKALEFELKEKKSAEEQALELVEGMEALRAEIAQLKAEKEIEKARNTQPSPEEIANKHVVDTAMKYLEEDKDKPRLERREMTKEELDDFLIEDFSEAQQWLVRRELRRIEDKKSVLGKVQQERGGNELVKKQNVFIPNLLKEFPSIKEANQRRVELDKQGKSHDEIEVIVRQEFPDYGLLQEVVSSDAKFREAEDAPLLTMQEMKKRRAAKAALSSKEETDTTDEDRIRQEAAESERQRQASLDAGIHSTTDGKLKVVEENLSEYEKRVLAMAAKKGITKEKIDAAKARRDKYGFGVASK